MFEKIKRSPEAIACIASALAFVALGVFTVKDMMEALDKGDDSGTIGSGVALVIISVLSVTFVVTGWKAFRRDNTSDNR